MTASAEDFLEPRPLVQLLHAERFFCWPGLGVLPSGKVCQVREDNPIPGIVRNFQGVEWNYPYASHVINLELFTALSSMVYISCAIIP